MKMLEGTPAQYRAALGAPWSVRRTLSLYLDKTRPAWTNARMIAAVVDVDAATSRAWLPPGLSPSEPARATIFAAWYPESSFDVAYHEAGVLLHARHRGRDVHHCAWMLVDDDTALILGREMVGFPKKLGAFTHVLEDDGTGRATVSRTGTEHLHMQARTPRELDPARAGVFTRPIVNVVASPMLATGVLWRMEIPERAHRAFEVELDLRVAGSAHDPLDALGIGERTVRGQTLVMDFAIPPERPGLLPPLRPVGLVPPGWLVSHLPFRTL